MSKLNVQTGYFWTCLSRVRDVLATIGLGLLIVALVKIIAS